MLNGQKKVCRKCGKEKEHVDMAIDWSKRPNGLGIYPDANICADCHEKIRDNITDDRGFVLAIFRPTYATRIADGFDRVNQDRE